MKLSLPLSLFQFVFLALSLSASIVLATHSIVHFKLPGCGIASGCAALSESRWGSLFGIPTSQIGVAWFVGMISLWFFTLGFRRTNRTAANGFRWLARLGLTMSLLFIVVILVEQKLCPWCLVVHFGNICFWAAMEFSRLPDSSPENEGGAMGAIRRAAKPVIGSAVIGGICLLSLATVADARRSAVEEAARFTLEASLERVIERSTSPGRFDSTNLRPDPFTGRFRIGPEEAALRLVIFTGYQCKQCQIIDPMIERFMAESPDGQVSVIHKHFPLSNLCNPAVPTVFHENACTAAAVAEAAGIIGGEKGFHKMHLWLMEKKGEFSRDDLMAALPGLGFKDPARFEKVMRAPETLALIREDVAEGNALGLNSTPVLFINGEIVAGLKSEDLEATLERLSSVEGLPVTGPENDRPILAVEKLKREWRDEETFPFPRDSETARWTMGPEDAKHHVIATVSYSTATMPELNGSLRELVKSREDIRLEFRHFPVSRAHNPRYSHLTEETQPLDWWLSLAVEAVATLRGGDAFWEMHQWLTSQPVPGEVTERTVIGYVRDSLGIGESEFLTTLQSESVIEAVRDDITYVGLAGNRARASGVYLNGQRAPTWRPPGQELWAAMLSE